MENTYSYRHFLICNNLANKMQGHEPQNYALMIIEEGLGRFANSQMTKYFYIADRVMCDLIGNDEGFMWDDLDMEEVAEIPVDVLENHYEEYCEGKISLDLNKNL